MKVVGQVLRERVREHPRVDFVVCDSERLTYAEAEARSRELARGLLAEGVGKASRVALLFPAGIPFVVAWLAVARCRRRGDAAGRFARSPSTACISA